METSINSNHGQVSWASLLRPTIKAERNILTKKPRKGLRGQSRKSTGNYFKESGHKNFTESQNSINQLKMSPRSQIDQPSPINSMITKKILKLSDVQINQKLELNRPGKIIGFLGLREG